MGLTWASPHWACLGLVWAGPSPLCPQKASMGPTRTCLQGRLLRESPWSSGPQYSTATSGLTGPSFRLSISESMLCDVFLDVLAEVFASRTAPTRLRYSCLALSGYMTFELSTQPSCTFSELELISLRR